MKIKNPLWKEKKEILLKGYWMFGFSFRRKEWFYINEWIFYDRWHYSFQLGPLWVCISDHPMFKDDPRFQITWFEKSKK